MNNLIPVLQSMEIHKVVSLDDDYDAKTILEHHKHDEIQDIINNGNGEQLSDQEKQCIDNSGIMLLGDVEESKALPLGIKNKLRQMVVENDTSNVSLSILENVFVEQNFEYKKLYGMEQISDEQDGKGILWLLDKEINGINILPNVLKKIVHEDSQEQSDLVVIVTYDDTLLELTSSWTKRFEYLNKEIHLPEQIAKQIAYSLFVVSKTQLLDKRRRNLKAAQKYFSECLIRSLDGCCVYNILKIMREHSMDSYHDLERFAQNSNQNTFEHVHYNMVVENDSNMFYILKNIYNMMHEKRYEAHIDKYRKYIFAMRKLSPYPPRKGNTLLTHAIKNIIKSYEWSKFQFLHTTVNSDFSDVRYGDIFKIKMASRGSHVIGVLITQPCDCVLRGAKGDEKMVCRKAKNFTLALFDECILVTNDDSVLASLSQQIRDGAVFYAIDPLEGESLQAFYIKVDSCIDTIHVAPFILDLVTLNKDGMAQMMIDKDIDDIIKKYKTTNWINYSVSFKKEIEKFRNTRDLIQSKLNEKADGILTSIYGIPFSRENNEFGIKRIGRLEENAMALIRYHYVAHTYRAGKNSLLTFYSDDDLG